MFDNEQHKSRIKSWLGSGSIILFGMPFAGKDTQSKKLAEYLNAKIIASGDILRGPEADSIIADQLTTGQLIPTESFKKIVLPFISRDEYSGAPIILNSVGRWFGEEKDVMQACIDSNHPIKLAINLQLDESRVIERWHMSQETMDRGTRSDDSLGVLAIRLKEFREKTLPVIEEYKKLNLVVDIDADKPRDDVYDEIIKALIARSI